MARRRRRRISGIFWVLGCLTGAAVGTWWYTFRPALPLLSETNLPRAGIQPPLTTARPEVETPGDRPIEVSEKGAEDAPAALPVAVPQAQQIESLVAAGEQALARNDLVAARTHFSEAMNLDPEEPLKNRLGAELTRLGNETVFSPRIYPNDPLVSRYVVAPGDTLARIAKQQRVSSDLIASINAIADKNLIRAGQAIKVIRGPFHARVDKRAYSLAVYLGNTFVRRYRVGLGADGSTPGGEWRVSTKLLNPTYYPPRGGRIIPPGDPENPLGGYWIGLTGVSGEAIGQERYGIHGTVEPDSIGKSTSLGCIRLFNEDVAVLYSVLVEEHSRVTVE